MRAKNRIIKLMRKEAYAPLTFEELRRLLEPQGISPKELEKALFLMEKEGTVIKTRREAYGLPDYMNLVIGHLQANQKGFGFVKNEDFEVRISACDINGAMHGDKVAVRLTKKQRKEGIKPTPSKAREGEVVHILERAHKTLVGKFEKRGKVYYVTPLNKKIFYDVFIPKGVIMNAVKGDIVVVEIDEYPDKRHGPTGRVVENLGNENLAGMNVEIVVREFDLPTEFPSDVLKECEEIPDKVTEKDIQGRKDYRNELVVTIDGLDAKDFDDAVSIKKEKDGNYYLSVHIADVSHYVALDSSLDKEAFKRGFSAYLVDRVIPMLPHKLSNGICSLNPNVDRFTLSVEMTIDSSGEVKNFLVTKGIINSNARLTYEEVDKAFIAGDFKSKEIENSLLLLRELSDILENKRVNRGSVNFETIEPKVVLDENLKPIEVLIREKTPATKLIEETMILTNEVTAGFMHQRSAPMIYRVHEPPDLEALIQIGELVKELGYPISNIKSASPKILQSIIKFAHNRPEKLLINYLMLRAMKQARYAKRLSPHFGLASDCYTHFTSPIRRYTDLVVHHFVKSALKHKFSHPSEKAEGSSVLNLADRLEEICERCSIKEREIDEAERESVEVKLCELMKDKIGEIFWGIITGVTSFGIFVELPNTAEGLIHVSDMTDDYYQFESEHFLLKGKHSGKVFRMGQKVLVKLVNVKISEKRIDFILA